MRLILTISVLVLFFSCKKEDNSTITTASTNYSGVGGQSIACPLGTTHAPLAGDLVRMKFLASTWWVYTDSVTLQTDSVYVDQAVSIPHHSSIGLNPCVDYEAFSCFYRHSFNSRTDTIFIMTGAWINGDMSNTFATFYPVSSTAFYIPYNSGNWTYDQQKYTSGQDTIIRLDSVFIYDRFYHQAETVIQLQDPDEGNLKTIYYVNADYGILRKDVFNANGTLKNKWVLKNKNVTR